MSDLAAFIARFHPFVVHVPIGALVVAGVLELLARTTRYAGVRAAIAPVTLVGAAGAITAATTGYLLGATGGYAGTTFTWHERAGIAVAIAATATALACMAATGRSARTGVATSLVALTLAGVVVTGHLGGTLTHGEGYLTARLPAFLRGRPRAAAAPRIGAEVVVYRDLVRPVLEAKCVACHGGADPKGGLRLDSAEGLKKGGQSGAVVVAGRSASSEIVRRVSLPISHKDAMPPAGRRPMTVSEAALVRWWIDQGASVDATLADLEIDPQVRPQIEAAVGAVAPGAPAILAVKVPPPDPAALAAVRRLGVSVSPLADGTPFVEVQCINVARTFGDTQLAALAPLAPQVTWLSLTGTQVTDAGLATLSRFANLTRLRLDRTKVGDAGLAHLAGLARLEYLNLYGTAVTDAGLASLSGLAALRDVYLWRTGVTTSGADRLRATRPKLRVNLGVPEVESAGYHAQDTEGSRARGPKGSSEKRD